MTGSHGWLAGTALALLLLPFGVQAEPAVYASPDAAVAAVVAAVEAKDGVALLAVFGPEARELVFSGDEVKDRATWRGFLESYREENRIEIVSDSQAVLHIGREDWPFPAPIVAAGGGWRFDPEAAREEVLDRRIGLNELDVIELLGAGVAVQARFRQSDHDGDGVLEFASGILSSPGTRDGLYWPAEEGTEESPIGDFLARASDAGYTFEGADQAPDPYLGYYYRILHKQGAAAPGGAYDYMVGGNMVAGHAYLAYPANYGQSGIMSFMVGEAGVVYEADLGPDTLQVAGALDSFDPGDGWSPVAPE